MDKQRIYRIDKTKDYQSLSYFVDRSERTSHMDWICDQWDRMGHFFASMECGHVTASTALKRLNGYSGKNHFYRGVRELGRIFKTEHILQYMSMYYPESEIYATMSYIKKPVIHGYVVRLILFIACILSKTGGCE